MHKPSQAVVRHLEMSSEAVGINPLEASPEETGRERGGERDHEHPEKQANTCGNKGGAMEGQIYIRKGGRKWREKQRQTNIKYLRTARDVKTRHREPRSSSTVAHTERCVKMAILLMSFGRMYGQLHKAWALRESIDSRKLSTSSWVISHAM